MGRDEAALKLTRRALFDQFDATDSAIAVYEFQIALADEIKRTEHTFYADRSNEEREHLAQLRLYGDALAWRLLDPYAIRQLSKHPGRPAAVAPQGDAFDGTMEMVREQSENGIPAIAADLTNCLKIGDVVVCDDPERPKLAESKSSLNPRYLGRGRAGRQLRRGLAVMELLYRGRAQLPDDTQPTITIATSTPVERTWPAVEETVRQALAEGRGWSSPAEGDVIWAVRKEVGPEGCPEPARELIDRFSNPCFGVHTRPLYDPSPLIPPPLVWPIAADARLALMEAEVMLVHVVDLNVFLRVEHAAGRVTAVLMRGNQVEEECFVVEAGGDPLHLSKRFLDDVLYGFADIRTAAAIMIEFAAEVPGIAANAASEVTESPPEGVALIRSEEEAQTLTDAAAEGSYGYVAMPREIYDKLLERYEAARRRKGELGEPPTTNP